jgi:hypothetical protein
MSPDRQQSPSQPVAVSASGNPVFPPRSF